MRFVRVLSLVALLIATLSFAATTYFENESNWRPVELPLPGPGLEVAAPFEIATAGRFELEVQVPQARTSSADLTLVHCDLQVILDGPHKLHVVHRITELRRGGSYDYGKIDLYESRSLTLERSGDYQIHVANKGSQQPFGERGAVVALTRYEHPTEAYLRGVLLRAIGWIALASGLIGAVLSRERRSGT